MIYVFVISVVLIVFGLKAFLQNQRPKWFFNNSDTIQLISSIKSEYELMKEDDKNYSGKINGFFSEFQFIIPENYIHPVRLRIDLNYKPERNIKTQENSIDKLRQKYPNFRWVSNAARIELTYRYEYPKFQDVKKCIDELLIIMQSEGINTMSPKESEQYHKTWDSAD